MEELLNKLIEKGWKPFGGKYYDRFIIESNGDICFRWKYPGADGESAFDYNYDYFKIRELVSKESGLWQFVCENGMYDYKMGEHKNIVEDFFWNERENCNYYGYLWDKSCWEYYVVESALCNEEDLEQFLIDNIKI